MLPKAARLRSRADFTATMRGRRAARGAVVVHVRTGDEGTPRAGFIVSKAVGNAVVRNRVKRRLRHLVAERMPDWPAGTSVVVRALPSAAASAYAELGADVDRAFEQARKPRRTGRERRG